MSHVTGFDSLSTNQQQQCALYLDLLERWNTVHNLTALKGREEMHEQLIEQSLQLVPYLEEGTVADVGTGGGIPGIPLAIAKPDINITMMDSRSKKTTFLQHVIDRIRLPHAHVIQGRVEDHTSQPFDMIVNRALGSIDYIYNICRPIANKDTRYLCVRGHFDASELSTTPLQLIDLIPLGINRANNLVILAQ